MTLAVENGGRRDLFSKQDEYLWLTEKALDVPLKKCIDVGHAAVRGWNLKMLVSLTDVVCVHVHDNDMKHDRHMIPGYGDIPWDSLLPLLRGKPLVLEIREYKTLDDFLPSFFFNSSYYRVTLSAKVTSFNSGVTGFGLCLVSRLSFTKKIVP